VSRRKTNSNAWYAELSEKGQRECFELMRGLGYVRARLEIMEKFDVTPSLGAMSAAYSKWSAEEQEAELLRAATDIEGIEEMTRELGEVDDTLRHRLNHAALAALVGGDPDQIKLLVSLALDARTADREDAKLQQRIAEFERKMAAAGEALDDTKLSAEEKEIRIREALGL